MRGEVREAPGYISLDGDDLHRQNLLRQICMQLLGIDGLEASGPVCRWAARINDNTSIGFWICRNSNCL